MLPPDYASIAIGKWHLGLDEDYPALQWHPVNRGFKESYNFMGRGGHDYFKSTGVKGGDDESAPLYRGRERIGFQGYLTTRFSEEAVAFIDRHKAEPFFLYLAYNAVHAPAQAPQADIDRVRRAHPGLSEARVILMAMLHHLDLGVGAVVTKLKAEGVWANTLLFFLTDNGGARGMAADNAPLRGHKASLHEGGIRTPFLVSWPARFPGGRTLDTPVISLDILPTALDALGAAPPAGTVFDGKSLLPLLTGATTRHHDTLYWSSGGLNGEWAVRHGDWKLHAVRDQRELIQLADDPAEARNLAAQQPDKVRQLTALYEAWLEPMAEPITGGSKRWAAAGSGGESQRAKERAAKKASRKQERAPGKQSGPTTPP
jgi:arylsulfatase A-like enzyme